MEDRIELHPSTLARWSRCEVSTLEGGMEDGERRPMHVAAWIGTSVHRIVSGEDPLAPPATMRFDKTTPSLAIGEKQISVMARKVRRVLDEWTITAQEEQVETTLAEAPWLTITGTCDWRMRAGQDQAIGDLKTGQSIGAAWLQLGAYSLCHGAIDYVAVVHLPRRELHKLHDIEPVLYLRDAAPCMQVARALIRRVARLLAGRTEPVHSPGAWCAYCTLDCPVRPTDKEEV